MYINGGYYITNTPTGITASYNTWTYSAPHSQWYQHQPRYYIDHLGNVREWNKWSYPSAVNIQGVQWKGTPTRTGAYTAQNTIIKNTNEFMC